MYKYRYVYNQFRAHTYIHVSTHALAHTCMRMYKTTISHSHTQTLSSVHTDRQDGVPASHRVKTRQQNGGALGREGHGGGKCDGDRVEAPCEGRALADFLGQHFSAEHHQWSSVAGPSPINPAFLEKARALIILHRYALLANIRGYHPNPGGPAQQSCAFRGVILCRWVRYLKIQGVYVVVFGCVAIKHHAQAARLQPDCHRM